QEAMLKKYPDAEKEVEGLIGDFLPGHCDIRHSAEDGGKVIVEIKSVADFAFMKATGIALKSSGRWHKKDDPPESPKVEHQLQAGIYAHMLDAPYFSIVYIRKTATLGEPVTHEWRFRTEDLIDDIKNEIDRHGLIVEMVKLGNIPDRVFEGRIIDNP